MALAPGLRLGPYEILAPVGVGGMGEVYRARDSRLGRDVAIKVLPPALSADPEGLRRFQQEARAAAALNHPNILAVHDLGQHDGSPYIVSELLEGETLRKRLSGGALPVRKAVECAVQIAHGLAAAHEKGIVHRDLKPENIFVTGGDRVKILDFGVAKLTQTERAADMTELRTLPPDTAPGLVLGTVGYMAPEQVRGLAADPRSDLFALGAVLYEMLSGRRAFHGDTTPDTMTAILREDPPDLPATQRHIPPALVRIVNRCLEKSPAARFKSADDLAFALETSSEPSGATQAVAVAAWSKNRERIAWMAALAIVALAAAAAVVRDRRPAPAGSEMRLDITTPPTMDPVSLAISPDGQKMVFVAASEGRSRLWLRSLDSRSARPLAGTDGASYPFWSPDSRSVAFFADARLKRLDIDGESVQPLADAFLGGGGTWNRDGVILFSPAPPAPIVRVSAKGSESARVTRLEPPQQAGHGFPTFLPDGRHFLYYVRGSPEARGVYVSQLEGSESRRLFGADSAAVYASSGQLLFVNQGTLFAQDFDPVRLELAGNPSPVAEQVAVTLRGSPALSASAAGPIAYRTGSADVQQQFVWLDRFGKEIRKVGDPSRSVVPTLSSPDGRHVALFREVNANVDVWLLDVERGVLTRFTSDPADDVFPVWSPDGTRIVFSSNRKLGVHDFYQKPASSAGSEELLLATAQTKFVTDWSPDGRFLLYKSVEPKGSFDIWAVPLQGDRKPFPVVQTNFEEREGQFSPDGKWIAYQSNESGRVEIYVQPFPGPGGKWQVSTSGGAQVRWRRDGKEVFYVALDGRLMAAPIRLASDGQAVDIGAPVPLFPTRGGGAVQSGGPHYLVSADGQRFLMNTVMEEAASPITLILNWAPTSRALR